MRRWLLIGLAVLIALPVLAMAGADIALNTGAGRAFAVREINGFAGPGVHVDGLGGHFPLDVKLANATLSDAAGPYATAANVGLRWNPLGLLHRHVDVSDLTAARLALIRLPQAAAAPAQPSKGAGFDLSAWRLDLAHLRIDDLSLPAAVSGRPLSLAVTGDAHVPNLRHVAIALAATAPGAAYRLTAVLTPDAVRGQLSAQEAPDGPIGHFATGLSGPLNVIATLSGPRANAAFTLNAGLGAAAAAAQGTLDLDQAHPAIDARIALPTLAPFGALAGQALAGRADIHLAVARTPAEGIAIALQTRATLTQGPRDAPRLLGPDATIVLLAHWRNDTLDIAQADVKTATGAVAATGTLGASAFDLTTHIDIGDVSRLSPGLRGAVHEDGRLFGTKQDFSVSAQVSGDISAQKIASGPFSLLVDAAHLPRAPVGTLVASGALENSPLRLDAAFSRTPTGTAHVQLHDLAWRSLSGAADLTLGPGADLPTGTATLAVTRLADLAPFAPVKLGGSATAAFSHAGGQVVTADVTARHLVVDPALGGIDATLHAKGPTDALAVSLQAQLAALMGAPARITTDAVFNADARSAAILHLAAAWHGMSFMLTGPAGVETKDEFAVRHLNADLNGAAIALDGTLTPRLAARASLSHLPLALARLFAPRLRASGTVSAQVALTGTLQRPLGPFSLAGTALAVRSGPAAQLPPATLAVSGTLQGNDAALQASLLAGPNLRLALAGTVPLTMAGAIDATLTGRTDLRLADPLVAASGYEVRGQIATDVKVTGTARAPDAAGTARLTGGSVENIGSGLNLTGITATLAGDGTHVDLQDAHASAGAGSLAAHGMLGLTGAMPVDLALSADHATPIASDTVTETISAALSLNGALRGPKKLSGSLTIDRADINIPHGLPPSIADLPILVPGAKPPLPAPPPPPVDLDLTVLAKNQIFVRGDGLFAELGGRVHIGGSSTAPDPQGGFDLIRGTLSLAGKTLQFTSGTISFNGDGFSPALDLEATSVTSSNDTVTLIVGGTAQHPTITLTSTPPLPSDEILAQLLFNQSTTSLTPFQAATLAAALAQLSGVGGGLDPLGAVRARLGLDQLSLSGSGSGAPSLQAGRYVAPGVFVGATQSAVGQGTQANVQINLYKGLKLQTSTGTSSSTSGASSSVGLTYQFNY